MSRRYPVTLCIVAFLLLSCRSTLAEIRPSFAPDYCAWHATDIVVLADEGLRDNRLRVLETWEGHFEPGETIMIPDLAGLRPEVSRPPSADEGDASPKTVTGKRLVVFLRRMEPSSRPYRRSVVWTGANHRAGMKFSTAWIEGDRVYAFVQAFNPGPSMLVEQPRSARQWEKHVRAVLARRAKLDKALAIAEPAERAKALKPMAGGGLYMQQRAFEGLADCGKPGAAILREMVADDAYPQRAVIEALVKALGDQGGAELVDILKCELAFWRELAPSLQAGWWNGPGLTVDEMSLYRNRYGGLYACLYSLRRLAYKPAAPVVEELREFWESMPQLQSKSGVSQIVDECGTVLRVIDPPEELESW